MPGTDATKLTYDDYVRLPDDGRRHEVIDGQEVMTPSPHVPHQLASGNVSFILRRHAKATSSGTVFDAPMDVVLGAHDIVQPDVLYISKSRSSIITRTTIRGAPDLVVEVVSPASAAIDRGAKLEL